ncbi:MAG: hypothetical protein J7599_18700 [Niabella sp.]|nr:hypothetical protein [Niabella sp.]
MKSLLLLMVPLFMTVKTRAQQQTTTLSRVDRMSTSLGLDSVKRYKVYWMEQQREKELAKMRTQFKQEDSVGRARESVRIEKKRDAYYRTVMTTAQYDQYQAIKKEFVK